MEKPKVPNFENPVQWVTAVSIYSHAMIKYCGYLEEKIIKLEAENAAQKYDLDSWGIGS